MTSQRRTRVKVCGVTRPKDAERAAESGADAIGVNFCSRSPRCVTVETARDIVRAATPLVSVVAVFLDESLAKIEEVLRATGIELVQLHGEEPPELARGLAPRRHTKAFCWRVGQTMAQVESYIAECRRLDCAPAGILLDTASGSLGGGSGATWDWAEAEGIDFPAPLVLAGGLNSDNVGRAVATLRPYAVDVASGVEDAPGVKDIVRMREFIQAVREADAASG